MTQQVDDIVEYAKIVAGDDRELRLAFLIELLSRSSSTIARDFERWQIEKHTKKASTK